MSREPVAVRGDFRVWRTLSTRWADNDAYGHVNNTVYYQWFDTAVNAWLIEQDMLDLVEADPIALVAETRCSFTAPLAFPQAIEVGLALAALGRSSIRYRIGIFAQGADTAAAQGEFLHVVVDPANHRPVSIPPSWREKLQQIS